MNDYKTMSPAQIAVMLFGTDSEKRALTTITNGGQTSSKAYPMDFIGNHGKHRWVKIQVNNTGTSNTAQTLRIGSKAGLAGRYELYNLSPAACDDTVITDQYGAGCKMTQGISLLMDRAVVFDNLRVISTNTNQLANDALVRTLYYDGQNDTVPKIISSQWEMSDNRTNMAVFNEPILIGTYECFEYPILANTTVSVEFEIIAANLTEWFNVLKF